MCRDSTKVVAEVILRTTQVVHGIETVVGANPSPLNRHLSFGIPSVGNEDMSITRSGIITEEQYWITPLEFSVNHKVPVLCREEIPIEQFHALIGELETVDHCTCFVIRIRGTVVIIHHFHSIATIAHQSSHSPALSRRISGITITLIRTVGTVLSVAVLEIPCIVGDDSLAAECLSVIHTVCTLEIH